MHSKTKSFISLNTKVFIFVVNYNFLNEMKQGQINLTVHESCECLQPENILFKWCQIYSADPSLPGFMCHGTGHHHSLFSLVDLCNTWC